MLNPSDKINQYLQEKFENKTVLILGFGQEGRSTYQLFKTLEISMELYVMDQNSEAVVDFLKEHKDTETRSIPKEAYLQGLEQFEFIFKTPGLPGYLLEHIQDEKIMSQSELFIELLGDRCIGITGTKGKSTTSSLIYHVLTGLGVDTSLVGNIGKPALESLLSDDGQRMYVYEMSSFQTEFLKVGPRYRVILNLFQEHLNNYTGYDAYQNSKLQLFKAKPLKEQPLYIYGCDNHQLVRKMEEVRKVQEASKYMTFGHRLSNHLGDDGCFIEDEKVVYVKNGRSTEVTDIHFSRVLLGDHNLLNALVSYMIAEDLLEGRFDNNQVLFEKVTRLLSEFKGLPHRLQYVGKFRHVKFYNDSIATIPEAALKGVEAIKDLDSIIIGGFDRGIDYSKFITSLMDSSLNIICLPTTGHHIGQILLDQGYRSRKIRLVNTMVEAVTAAYELTAENMSCLLSPAASSYNLYNNFEERGNHFMTLIKEYSEENN